MTRLASLACFVLAWVCVAPASAQPSLAALHPQRADVDVTGARGLVRLPLAASVAQAAGPGLARLRLVDAAGESRPFVVATAPLDPALEVRSEPLVPLAVRNEDLATVPPSSVERYRLPAPPAADASTQTVLACEVGRASFTATAVLVDADGHRDEVSLFRMPDGTARLELLLPAARAAGPLELELRTQGGQLTPTFRYVTRRPPASEATVSRALEPRAVRRSGAGIDFDVALPVGFVAGGLSVSLPGSGAYGVVVTLRTDAGDDIPLARDPLRTLPARVLPLPPLVGRTLRVHVEGRAEVPAIEAVVTSPSLVFEAVGEADAGLAIVFGGDRDLGEPATELSRTGITHTGLPLVRHADPVGNPVYVEGNLFDFAVRPGERIARARYTHRAPLDVPRRRDGLVRVVLPAAIASAVSSDLAELRIVDAEGRPYPFVMRGHAVETRTLALTRQVEAAPRTSRFRATLPGRGLALEGLALEPAVPSMHRRVAVSFPDDPAPIVTLDLVRLPGETDAIPVGLSGQVVRTVELVVEDGDEAALRPTLTATVHLPELLVAAPEGRLTLLYGAHEGDTHDAPDYELARYTQVLARLEVPTARVGSSSRNPDADPPSPWSRHTMLDVVGYVALGLVALGLLAYTLRMLAREPSA